MNSNLVALSNSRYPLVNSPSVSLSLNRSLFQIPSSSRTYELEFRMVTRHQFDFYTFLKEKYSQQAVTQPEYQVLIKNDYGGPSRNLRVLSHEQSIKQSVKKEKVVCIGLEWNVGLSIEEQTTGKNVEQFDVSRLITRTSISFPQCQLDLSHVKQTNLTRDMSYEERYEIELEYKGKALDAFPIMYPILCELVTLFVHAFTYVPKNLSISKWLTLDETLSLSRSIETRIKHPFLRLRSQAINMKRNDIPYLSTYGMTNKLDGERRFLYYEKGTLFLLHTDGPNVARLDSCIPIVCSSLPPTLPCMLLDTEYSAGTFYVFDVIYMEKNGRVVYPTSQVTLSDRLQMIQGVVLKELSMVPKTFYMTTELHELIHGNRNGDGSLDSFFILMMD